MKPPVREVLTVVHGGAFSAGLSFYGLGRRGLTDPTFPAEIWLPQTECQSSRLHGEAWEVVVWDVALAQWPRADAWLRAMHGTLAALLDADCVVAWVGREGYFCDPPDLFDPACMSDGVLAARTQEHDFTAALDPDEPLSPLSDEHLVQLRRYANGLADAV